MIDAQGGDPRVTEDPGSILPRAPSVLPLLADRTGIVATIDAEAIGIASSTLGAGRARKGEQVDPAVGIVFRPKIGDRIEAGEPIGEIHARTRNDAEQAAARTLDSMTVIGEPVEPPPLIHGWFPPDGGG
jgi:pyrimidine-nucleoside phosphorylase